MFITRTLSSIVLVLIALGTILSGDWVLAITLAIISVVGYFELTKAMNKQSYENEKNNGFAFNKNKPSLLGFLGIILFYILGYFSTNWALLFMVVIGMIMFTMFIYVFAFPKYHIEQIMSCIFSFIYGPVMLSFVFFTRELPYGIYLVWLIFISSWISDTCAYLVGITIGKHKYVPKLSPKKSLEGAIGGVIGAGLVGGLYGYFLLEPIITTMNVTGVLVLICMVGSVISQVGDLTASAIKRNYDIKDYGALIPGHGGIMDRFDSVIFTAPIIYFLALFLIK